MKRIRILAWAAFILVLTAAGVSALGSNGVTPLAKIKRHTAIATP
jgi:hypothetical protein